MFKDNSCNLIKCGNGILNSNEECDDKNNSPDDGCSSTCKIESKHYCIEDNKKLPSKCGKCSNYCQKC